MNSVERNGWGKPVVALDIDGTSGDYHSHFIRFARGWFGRDFPSSQQYNPGLPFHQFLGLDIREYRECKLAYRQGGLKRTMPVYPGVREFTAMLRMAGAEIWICTTRPYNRLDNIDPDTREWLRRNAILHDHILYGDDKYDELVRQVSPERIVAVIDDLPEMTDAALRAGVEMIWVHLQPYNRHINGRVGVNFFSDFEWLTERIRFDIEEWKENNDGRA